MSNELLDALRRSVAARNGDPARMRDWLEDFAERLDAACGKEETDDGDQRDPV